MGLCFEGDTAWLTQASLAELYQTTPQNIAQHIAAIHEEGELDEATRRPFLQVRQEGSRKVRSSLKFYSLPVIIDVADCAAQYVVAMYMTANPEHRANSCRMPLISLRSVVRLPSPVFTSRRFCQHRPFS